MKSLTFQLQNDYLGFFHYGILFRFYSSIQLYFVFNIPFQWLYNYYFFFFCGSFNVKHSYNAD